MTNVGVAKSGTFRTDYPENFTIVKGVIVCRVILHSGR